jgi:hypothetical protein
MISQTDIQSSILECQICFEEYNNNNKKPVVLDCGHSICQICLQQILSSNQRNLIKCPFDNKPLQRSFNQYPVNWSYIDVITSKFFIIFNL